MTHLSVRGRRGLSERFSLDLDFAFDFDASQPVAALFGPSGCGKSTTLALIAGLLALDEGRIELDGKALIDTASKTNVLPENRAVGMVAQDGLLFPHMSVGGNLLYAERRARGRRHAPRGEVVAALSLASLWDRSPPTLSGGERQRVALARALLSGPRLLLLDEPVSALDESARWEALSLIEHATRQFAVPTLFVSHQRTEVARIARETARMEEGRVVTQGDTAAVLADSGEGSVPNLFRGECVEPGYAMVAGGATIQLPRRCFRGDVVWCRLASGAVALADVGELVAVSARNRLAGRVVTVEQTAGRVRVAVDAGVVLYADVTPETARRFSLDVGAPIACVFKVHSLEVLP